MKAKVTKAFPGLPDGAVKVVNFEVGDVVTGDLARVAVENGWAKVVSEPVSDAPKSKGKAKG